MSNFAQRALAATVVAMTALLTLASAAQAGGQAQKGPAPSWTDELPAPPPNPGRIRQVQDGLYFLLVDRQERVDGAEDVDFRRKVYTITDRTGLESAAQIDIDFDPSDQELVFHRLRVIRQGVVLDRLRETGVTVLRREEDLDDGVETGMRTAHLQLRDVRVGDTVDYAFSWRTHGRTGQASGSQSLGWSTPVGLTRLRLLWPQGRHLTVKRFAGAPAGQVSVRAGWEDHRWQMADENPIAGEKDTPTWYDPWPKVMYSSAASWAEVVGEELPLYPTTTAVPAAWAADVDRIAAAYANPDDRITEALRLVQDRIRYVSLSIGEGAYRPRSPEDVVRSGYGDCKDKALLLVVILRRLGVDAAPALTDTEHGRALPEGPPGLTAFNHAIVRVRLGGKSFWLDPTRSHEGGRFPHLRAARFGWALPIVPGQATLESIPGPRAEAPTMEAVERFELTRRQDPSLRLNATTTYRADEADAMRRDIAKHSPFELEKKYLSYYAGLYPGIRSATPLAITDDRDQNIVVVRESYELPAADLSRADLRRHFPIDAPGLTEFDKPPAGERHAPLALDYPVNRTHRIILVTPGFKPPAPEDTRIAGAGFTYARHASRVGDTLQIDHSLSTTGPELPPDKVADFRSDLEALDDAVYAKLDLESKSGGSIGGAGWQVWVALGLLGVAMLAGFFMALRLGLKADAAYAGYGRYYPVTLTKFVLMSVATLGFYDFFWAWKCWRWVKANGRPEIWPFWRSVFRVFWLMPLFEEVNHDLRARAVPARVGAVAAVIYFVAAIAASAAPRLGWPAAVSLGIPVASNLCLVPAVIAVQRQNEQLGDAVIRRNSRFSSLTATAVGFGVIYWGLALFGLNS